MASVAEREAMYALIVGQLRTDGFEDAAKVLSEKALGGMACAPSGRLSKITELGIQSEGRQKALDAAEGRAPKRTTLGLDLDNVEPAATQAVTRVPVQIYQSKHRGEVRAACFSKDGAFAATADFAALVKIYSVQKVLAIAAGESTASAGSPVIRTIAGQKAPINDLAFHPDSPVLISASQDRTICFYDFQQPHPIRPSRTIQESHNVRTFAIHPAGTFLLAGTDHPILRLYDVNTAQCYATQNAYEHHTAPISVVRYNLDGRHYASGCLGGQIKLWDGISGRCINTFNEAHQGTAITSLQFTRNGNYLLSGGQDSAARLWDVRTGKVILNYMGATADKREIQSCFSDDELEVCVYMLNFLVVLPCSHVSSCCLRIQNQIVTSHPTMCTCLFVCLYHATLSGGYSRYSIDESCDGVCSWDASTGYNYALTKSIGAGKCLAHSPTHKLLLGGGGEGMDTKARFWALRTEAEVDAAGGGAAADDEPGASITPGEAEGDAAEEGAGDVDAYKQFLASTASVVEGASDAAGDTGAPKRGAEADDTEDSGAAKKARAE
eukprot:m.54103 g.54103  ORF g.54103 m.54103 type:complete len:553 (+) comp7507_c0_seq1:73-1731(+)